MIKRSRTKEEERKLIPRGSRTNKLGIRMEIARRRDHLLDGIIKSSGKVTRGNDEMTRST